MSSPEKSPEKKNLTIASTTDLFSENPSKIISDTHTDELVIALCGPIGSPLHRVSTIISQLITETFNYDECKVITLSDYISQNSARVDVVIPSAASFEKIDAQIKAGNKLREKYGHGVLAELAIADIRLQREKYKNENKSEKYETRRVCHIIDSIKNKEELDILRLVYRDMVYVMGVFSPLSIRVDNLQRNNNLSQGQIYELIDRDSGEESKAGQSVADTFPNSDFFLRIESGTDVDLKDRVLRFLHLILGTSIITPTSAETAMYAAAMASANSACLSRQVGAAVTDSSGEILGIGWNDVPKVGGGLYIDSAGAGDNRCWNLSGGMCFNDNEKNIFAAEVVSLLEDVIPKEQIEMAKNIVRKSGKLSGLIEFSRAIHAEMHAIINAAKAVGDKMNNGKIYVTTYPCHSCARHIIAAGIKEVFFIEPYRKSLAVKLHSHDITEQETDTSKVRILAYDGVAPSKYLSLFRVPPNSRKKDGKLTQPPVKSASPRNAKSLEALPALEGIVVTSLLGRKLIDADPPG